MIGGAGGSMNHLRLRDVGSEDEMRSRAAARKKEKAAVERERRKGMTPEQREAEDKEKQSREDRIHAAERHVIETVREKRGGVDADLTDEDTAGLSEKAAERLKKQHHRKQLGQAMKIRKQVAQALTRERMEQLEDEAAVDATIRETPDLWTEAHELGQRELALIEAEEEVRRENRRPVAHRADAEEKARQAQETLTAVIEGTDREEVAAELEKRGGRAGKDGALPQIIGEKASDEQHRRAAEAADNALILAEAAQGGAPSDDAPRASVEFAVIEQALREAGIGADATPEERSAALAQEAAIQMQRAELARIKAQKFEDMEAAGNGDRAMRAMVHSDVVRGLTAEVRDATRKLGLREDAKTPLRQAEVAEMMDVLGSFEKLRAAKRGLDEVVEQEKKAPTYDRSRRGFALHLGEPADNVVEQVEEQVLRELATRILGLADTKSSDHVKAVTDGHYAKLADISLAVSNANHVPRTVVDAVGLKNAGVLLRHALEQEGHEPDALHDALVGHHIREQKKLTADALRAADAFVPDMEGTVAEVGDLEHAMRKLDASEEDIASAQRAIGSALGQMESTATLAQTFRGKQPEHLTLDLPSSSEGTMRSHLTWLASVGLQPGDYEVDTAKNQIRIPKKSWDKLLHKEHPHAIEQRKQAHAIKRGELDEEGWMPRGMVSRSSTSFTDPPASAPRYHAPLDLHSDDIHTSLADHIGARLANGERPADISTDLLSPNVAGKSADPEAFTDLVRDFFPIATEEDRKQEAENARIRRERGTLTDQYRAAQSEGDAEKVADLAAKISALPKEAEVKAKRDTDFADHYNKIATDYLGRHHPGSSPLHAESLYRPGVDEGQVREAVFRALANNPEHVAAFTPIGELQPDHRKALQDYFYKRAGIEETRNYSAEFGERVKGLIDDIHSGKVKAGPNAAAAEAAGQGGMFGGGGLFGGPPKPAAKPATPTVVGPQYLDKHGGNAAKAADALADELDQKLKAGGKVTLYYDGKPIEIAGISRGMLQDAKGQRWGLMNVWSDKNGSNRVEVHDVASAAPAAPQKPKGLTPETLGELHPDHAKALAYEYPREGADLFRQAMGPRPAEPTGPSKLSPAAQAAVEKVREGNPTMKPADLAKAAARQIGRERALKEAGLTEEDLKKVDRVTGELTPAARRAAGKVEIRAADLAEKGINPQHVQESYGHLIHDAEHEEFAAYAKKYATPWASFVDMHGGLEHAYTALQEEMRGEFAGNLRETYGKVAKQGLRTSIAEVPNADLHAQALASPKDRAELAEQRREEVRKLQERAAKGAVDASGKAIGGKYQAGSALEKYRQAKDAERSHAQRQGGLFGAAPPAAPGKLIEGPSEDRTPKAGERLSLGKRIEQEVSALVGGTIGKTLDFRQKVRLFAGATMDGRRIHQQRVIKMLRTSGGRLGAWLGTGSGKTPTSIGAFTDLHATGDTSHGLFLVPTAVQSQFGEEMLSFTEPGRYNFETGSGKGHHERAAMLRDKGVHMRVMTHQSAARTVLKLTADHAGVAPEAMLERLRGMSDKERAQTVREAMDAHGIPRHYTYVDEAHTLTTRQGEQESDTSVIIGALSHPINATHALFGTATPHKNDTSEVYSMARLLHPDRYSDAYRFTQQYGVGSVAAPDAIRRELDGLTYTASIPPDGVSRLDTPNPQIGEDGKKTPGGHVEMDPAHAREVEGVHDAYRKADAAYRDGGVDVESTKKLNPDRFKNAPEDQHEAIARELAPSLGIVKETALRKALQLAPIEHNAKLRRMVETIDHDLKQGKPGIVFTDSAEEAHHVHQTLANRGIASGVYHGGLDNNARDKFRKAMKSGQLKVGVMTSAGEAGINLQDAKTIHHYDVPKTAKSWSQRNGRAYRQGQKDDVDVHDWTFDHDYDRNGIRRLQEKGRLADVFQTPLGPLDEHGFARDYNDVLNQRHAAFDLAAK